LVGGKTPDQSVHLNLTTTIFLSEAYRAFGDALFLSLAETTIEFASHDPQRAREIIALGFEAMWHALHEADAK
ncbi:hypothetical protein Q5N01_14315, partial [Klebsiella pneumoniae]|nr:hypothetical protein [Klebsiella pneumoniae]MDO7182500.1 hypothetical protein [Klebsiella pneumoniae]